jgi:hypothetical protein
MKVIGYYKRGRIAVFSNYEVRICSPSVWYCTPFKIFVQRYRQDTLKGKKYRIIGCRTVAALQPRPDMVLTGVQGAKRLTERIVPLLPGRQDKTGDCFPDYSTIIDLISYL